MSGIVSGPWEEEYTRRQGNGVVVGMPLDLRAAALPDPATIPPREWLYGTRLIRRFVTLLVAPGGTGKTQYAIGVAMALASGKPILGEHVHKRVNTWVMNLEDPMAELDRRVAAMMIRHKLGVADLAGRLFLHSGRDRRVMMAVRSDAGYDIIYPDRDGVIAAARSAEIGAIVVDPFVASHGLEENSNPEMDAAVRAWIDVGEATGASIFLIHHTRKGMVQDIDAARGGKALSDAARVGLTMAAMTPEEADKLGVEPAERWRYVRLDDAKVNMAPRAEKAEWLQLEPQELGNGNGEYPRGDKVASIAPWEPPGLFLELTPGQLNEALDVIALGAQQGIAYSPTRQGRGNARWVGVVLVQVLGVTEGQADGMVKAWLASGLLIRGEARNPESRKMVACVMVDDSKRPTVNAGGGYE